MTEILNVETVAKLLHCDEKTVAERLVNGDLPGAKFGRSWVVPAAALFQRINDIATEEAAARRKNLRQVAPVPQGDAQPRRGRKRFTVGG